MIIQHKKFIFSEVGENHNKVWEIELHDNDNVIVRWGRIGYSLQEKAFRGGQTFFNRKITSKLAKGYSEAKIISNSASTLDTPVNNLEEIAKKQIKMAKSNPILENLIERLVKANIHQITSNTKITFNSSTGLFSSPLGIVTLDAIQEARVLLGDIKPFVVKKDLGNKKLFEITSKYLRLIPSAVGMKLDTRLLFPDETAIIKQSDILDSLEASYNALKNRDKTNEPLISESSEEKIFEVELDLLEDKKEQGRIGKWFYNSNHRTHGYSDVKIKNIYVIKIVNNYSNFNSKLGNITEVFHSTGEANLLSILKSGLKLSPPITTYLCGSLFGRGHYGAVDSSKSLQYTFGRFGGNKGNSGWSFVAEFAMGNVYYIDSYGGSLKTGYNSIWAKKERTGLRFDELIVPTDEQVRLKYLLEVG